MPTPAHAGTIDDCYSAAEAAHSSRSITIHVGQTVALNSGSLSAVFDKVAELHQEPLLGVTYNTAGRNALRQAMSCVIDAGATTLSAVYLNERVQNLAVRPQTGRVQDASGQLIANLKFDKVEESSCSTGLALLLHDDGGTQSGSSLWVPVVPFDDNDVSIEDVNPDAMAYCYQKMSNACDGDCIGECSDDDPPVVSCYCDGSTGECSQQIPPVVTNPLAVFTTVH